MLGNRRRTWIFIPDFLLHDILGSLHKTKAKVLTFCLENPRVIHGFATIFLGMSKDGFSIRLYSKQTQSLPCCLLKRQKIQQTEKVFYSKTAVRQKLEILHFQMALPWNVFKILSESQELGKKKLNSGQYSDAKNGSHFSCKNISYRKLQFK